MSKKYWLHRISHNWEVSYVLFEKGYLSLGWSVFANTNILESARKSTSDFEMVYSSKKDKKHRSRWNIWYLAQFKPDDIVVVPLYNGEFSICRVIEYAKPISTIKNELGDFVDETGKSITWENDLLKRVDDNSAIDLGFVVKVERIRTEKRAEYADSVLTSRMKMRQTNGDISDLKDSINAVIAATKPINFYENAIADGSESLLKRIQQDLNPDKFENLVKAYLKRLGANETRITAKNEHGKMDYADADVIAYFESLRVSIQVQVKFHTGHTSEWSVEQILKYKEQLEDTESELSDEREDYFVNVPWVISSCESFTKEAITLAEENHIRLINGLEFSRMLIDVGLANIDV